MAPKSTSNSEKNSERVKKCDATIQKQTIKHQSTGKTAASSRAFNSTAFERKMASLMPIPYGEPLGLYKELGLEAPTEQSTTQGDLQDSYIAGFKTPEHPVSSSENLETRFKKISLKEDGKASLRTPFRDIANVKENAEREWKPASQGSSAEELQTEGSDHQAFFYYEQKWVMMEFEAENPMDYEWNGNSVGSLSPTFERE